MHIEYFPYWKLLYKALWPCCNKRWRISTINNKFIESIHVENLLNSENSVLNPTLIGLERHVGLQSWFEDWFVGFLRLQQTMFDDLIASLHFGYWLRIENREKGGYLWVFSPASADPPSPMSLVGVGTSSSWGSPLAAPIHELTWFVSPENIFTDNTYIQQRRKGVKLHRGLTLLLVYFYTPALHRRDLEHITVRKRKPSATDKSAETQKPMPGQSTRVNKTAQGDLRKFTNVKITPCCQLLAAKTYFGVFFCLYTLFYMDVALYYWRRHDKYRTVLVTNIIEIVNLESLNYFECWEFFLWIIFSLL